MAPTDMNTKTVSYGGTQHICVNQKHEYLHLFLQNYIKQYSISLIGYTINIL